MGIRKLRRCGGPTRESLERVRRWSERLNNPEAPVQALEKAPEAKDAEKNPKPSSS